MPAREWKEEGDFSVISGRLFLTLKVVQKCTEKSVVKLSFLWFSAGLPVEPGWSLVRMAGEKFLSYVQG